MADPKPESEQFRDFGVHPRPEYPSAQVGELERTPDADSERRLAQIRDEGLDHAARDFAGRHMQPGVYGGESAYKLKGALAPGQFPKASPQTGYYGIPMLKEPQWTEEIPLYFFVGGAGGAAAVIAEAARMSGWDEDSKIVRDARTIAAVGAIVSPALLVMDLGRPSRFLYMLRVFKPNSAMSVGVYIVSVYGTAAFLTKFHEFLLHELDIWPVRLMQELTSTFAALAGVGMATYTGVLIGATAIPVWNHHVRSIPVHFAMSGTACATGVLTLMGNDNRALNVIGLATSAFEIAEGIQVEGEDTEFSDPLRYGFSGTLTRIGGVLSGPLPFALRAASLFTSERTSRKLRRAASVCSVLGSLTTRFAWISAGHASAKDFRLPLQLAPEQRDLPERWRPSYADNFA